MKKYLIVTPPLDQLGGVSGHFSVLRRYWGREISFFEKYKSGKCVPYLTLLFDYFRFIWYVLFKKPSIIVINLSLKRGFYSAAAFAEIARLLRKKYVLFFHGWDDECEKYLESYISRNVLCSASGILVLSQRQCGPLLSRGVSRNRVFRVSTKVDELLLKGFSIKKRTGSANRLLFVSRVEKMKGIYIALEVYRLLKQEYPSMTFDIVGDGMELSSVRQYIKVNALPDVRLHGRLHGEMLSRVFADCDLFILPSYSEGMPAAVLEAMAFGLPVVTRYVGALEDFFEDEKMGLITSSLCPKYYFKRMVSLIKDPVKVLKISNYNYSYAKKHFYASKVAASFVEVLDEISNMN